MQYIYKMKETRVESGKQGIHLKDYYHTAQVYSFF